MRRSGFTLTEILVSIAIALILIGGIVTVFNTAAATISAGSATSQVMRDQRAAFSTLRTDFEGYKSDASTGIVPTTELPFLLLHSQKIAAYMDDADRQADADAIVTTIDLDGDGAYTSVGEDVSAAGNQYIYNGRNHRTDVLGFFSKGSFRRSTGQLPPGGGDECFVTDQGSDGAYIWYGHLRVVNNQPPPGTPYNPAQADLTATDINDNNRYARQWVLGRVVLPMIAKNPLTSRILDSNNVSQVFIEHDPARTMSPFSWDSFVGVNADGDVRGALIESYRDASANQRAFYDLADSELGAYRVAVQGWQSTDPLNWWRPVLYADLLGQPVGRFSASAYISKPPNSSAMSMNAPYFLSSCTQFYVEFAGNFLTQNASGDATLAAPDATGEIDFQIVNTVRGIRWYGLQRDTDADGTPDVMPVRNVPGSAAQGFEKVVNADEYTCAWGPVDFSAATPSVPSLIRITIQIIDRNARLGDGLTQEFVFKVR